MNRCEKERCEFSFFTPVRIQSGPDHRDVAKTLNDLGNLYVQAANYSKAKPLLERALSIREKVLGPQHPDTAQTLEDLGVIHENMGDLVNLQLIHPGNGTASS